MRRAFTLIEAIAAVVVLSLAAPPTYLLLRDAADARQMTVAADRAMWLSAGVMEHIIADVESNAPGLGPGALDDPDTYLNHPASGLRARIENMTAIYEAQSITCDITIGDLVSASATTTGDAALDVFRIVTVTVTWPGRNGASARYTLSRVVTVR